MRSLSPTQLALEEERDKLAQLKRETAAKAKEVERLAKQKAAVLANQRQELSEDRSEPGRGTPIDCTASGDAIHRKV